jgi:hypothetical protein
MVVPSPAFRPPLGFRVVLESRDTSWFIGAIEIKTVPERPRLLTDETALALGWAEKHEDSRRVHGRIITKTVVRRYDLRLRLHSCRLCRAPFIAHYAAHFCSEACVDQQRQAWFESYRLPRRPRQLSKIERYRMLYARRLAQLRCQHCKQPLQAQRLTARFCSKRCRRQHRCAVRAGQGVSPPAG